MANKSKRFKEIEKKITQDKQYSLEEAIEVLQSCPKTAFDQSVEVSIMTGADVKKSDQQVRNTVSLPHGIGKKIVLVALAKGDKLKEAQEAGADFAGNDDLIDKIKGGWTAFDAMVVTPDMMREVGKLGKILGPRGLMPTPKAGTVTGDIAKAVHEIKAGKVEYRIDKNGQVNNLVGKLSFDKTKLMDNITTLLKALIRSKPSSAKGNFIRTFFISSTMGPGLRINLNEVGDVKGVVS